MPLNIRKLLSFYKKHSALALALHLKDKQHQRILNNAIDGFWLLNKQMQLIEVNDSYCKMSGYKEAELKSLNIADLQSSDSKSDISEHLLLHQNRFESKHRRKDGSTYEVEVSIQFLPYNGGQIAAFFQDISLRKKIEENLQNIESFQLSILNSVSAQIAVLDNQGFITLTNQAWKDFAIKNSLISGLELSKTDIGANYLDVCQTHINTDTNHNSLSACIGINAVLKGTLPEFSMEYTCHTPSEQCWIRSNVTPISINNGAVVSHTNITEHKLAEAKLKLAASVFTHAHEGILITDNSGAILQVNDAFSEITGFNREEVLNKNPRILSSGHQGKEFYDSLWRDLLKKGHWYGEIWNRNKNGEVYVVMEYISSVYNENGNSSHYVALMSDITLAKKHEHDLEHSAHYDALTNLPNRVLLADRIQQAIAVTKRQNQILAVVFLDLDGFKTINDSFGHLAGDQLLISVANNMKECLREVDTLARIGGDEFIILLVDVGDAETCAPLLNRLLKAASQTLLFADINLQITASMGITFYPQTEEVDGDILIRQADQAMYQAKLAGKNCYHVFDLELDNLTRTHHENLKSITKALNAGEFRLHYQPKVNLRLGCVTGVEALIRWQHPEKGLLAPAEFLPLIENHQLSLEIGEWVINTTMDQIEAWHLVNLDIPISVNVSAKQLQQEDFVERLKLMLAAHPKVNPGDLEMEVLETNAMRDLTQVSKLIEACSELGVKFALDDFGTGYSSLTYLKRLPVSQIKIDQSFVRDMLNDFDDLSIVEGVLALASAFNLEVIAEGMETKQHGEILLQLGCDIAQGFAIAKPMPAAEIPDWIKNWKPDTSWHDRPSFTRDDLPLLFANAEYRVWLEDIEKYLLNPNTTNLPNNQHSRFGAWLKTKSIAKDGIYLSAQTLHQQLNAFGAELVKLHADGKYKEALAKLPRLKILQQTLLEKLQLLIAENWHQ